MLVSKIKTFYESSSGDRLCQGDVLRDIKFSSAVLNYAVIMSQDCDLELDYKNRQKTGEVSNNDKFLPTILVCPAYTSEQFFKGEHIDGWKMRPFINDKEQEKIIKNNENRYHFLGGESKLSIPDLVIDFKHFYTIPTEIILLQSKSSYLATVNELFRERLSQRFSNYLSRFGLPELSEVKQDES